MNSRLDLSGALGETLEETVTLFSDEAETHPLDLTGWTIEVVLEPNTLGENPPVKLVGGLSIPERKNGQVLIAQALTPTTFDVGLGHWFMRATNPSGAVSYPKSGRLTIGKP